LVQVKIVFFSWSLLFQLLEQKFSVYGRITGIDINPNGFSFVQFAHLEDAFRAVNGENGTLLKQRKLGKLIKQLS
jgi:RNA-binding protein